MNQSFKDEDTGSREELQKLIENIENNVDLYESVEKFVKVVEKNNLHQQETCASLLLSFCDVLREKGYPVVSETFAEKWHIK